MEAQVVVRGYHRCGGPRGYLCKLGICRICFRDMAPRGEIPGVHTASW